MVEGAAGDANTPRAEHPAKPVPLAKKIVAGALSLALIVLLTTCVMGMTSWLYFYLLAAFSAVYAFVLQHRLF